MMFKAVPHQWLVPHENHFHVKHAATAPPKNGESAKDWKSGLEEEAKKLGNWQHKLYADGRHALLLVFQALDAAGKDGTIRHVLDNVNPCGLNAVSFKQPSALELAHDFLWRTTKELPPRGAITVFNRSYYEEVLVVRVHPQLLAAQRVPEPASDTLWQKRLRAIAEHERYLAEQGIVILKFWLNISRAEQRKRFLDRIDEPAKHWKFSATDLREREHWDAYMTAYQDCLGATSRPWAPWYAIPADDKHYMRWQVAKLINDSLEQLGVDFPALTAEAKAGLEAAREELLAERD
jgi:PPK2 family polyphosphate:nucleotide phosphotransferase